MKSKRFILNALLVVAILTLLVFSYSYTISQNLDMLYTLFFPAKQLTTLTTL